MKVIEFSETCLSTKDFIRSNHWIFLWNRNNLIRKVMKWFLVNILNFTLHCVNDVYFHVIWSGFDGHREAVWCLQCWGSPFSSCLYFLNLCRGISMYDSVCIAQHDWKWFKSIISANNKLISICWRNYRPRFFHWVVTTGYSLNLYLTKA